MEILTHDRFSSFSSSHSKIVLLLYVRDSDLSSAALRSLSSMSPFLRAEGFEPVAVDVTNLGVPISEELSCVRVPQVRVVLSGNAVSSFLGFPDSTSDMSSFLESAHD